MAFDGLRYHALPIERKFMMALVYKPGDLVALTNDFANQPRLGPFEILRVMPSRDNAPEQYRVRGPDGRERAIDHYEIVADAAGGAKQ